MKQPRVELQRETIQGVQLVTFSRGMLAEYFVTAQIKERESVDTFFARVVKVLAPKKAWIVSMELFGMSRLDDAVHQTLAASFGEVVWPVTWVEPQEASTCTLAGIQIWAVSGTEVMAVESDEGNVAGCFFEDGYVRYFRVGGLLPDESLPKPAQSDAVFGLMDEVLGNAGMTFSQVVRTWFYNAKILDWYAEFNKSRNTFFTMHAVFDGLVPASTGIGGRNPAGAALVTGLLALDFLDPRAKAYPVPSPAQCPALQYGSSFSRAVELDLVDHRRLLVSGTASIAPEGHTVFVGDIVLQIARTMEVVEAILLSREMNWQHVTRAIAYFKYDTDAPAFEAYLREHDLLDMPVLYVHNDVCRDDLLFEVELDALLPVE